MYYKNVIQNWVNEVGKPASIIVKEKTIHIYTQYPGIFIGFHGETINKYKNHLIGYNIEFHELQETFIPGNDFDKIMDERFNAFCELEGF